VTTLLLINQQSHIERNASEGEGEIDAVRARVFRDVLGAGQA